MGLKSLWEDHRQFTEEVLRWSRNLDLGNLSEDDRKRLTEKYLLSIHTELSEVLGNLDWKDHRKRYGPLVQSNILEELIDVQKYLWGLMQIHGVSVEDFTQAYEQKSLVIWDRLRSEKVLLTKPIIVVDIDEVLYRYDESFREWLKDTHPHMEGMTRRKNATAWEEVKSEYRQSHAKQDGKAYKDNVDALQKFKTAGWTIVLMTYRPAKIYGGLEYDTLVWLRQHKVPYDKIIWAAYEKHLYMRDELKKADVFVDDDEETCKLVAALGIRTYRIDPNLSDTYQTQYKRLVGADNLLSVCNLEGID